MVRKLISEFVGTMLLVIFGCGVAVATNGYVAGIFGAGLPFTIVAISLAFGLVLTALVYTIGNVSGCHVNPAVSLAKAIDKRMNVIECIEYIVVQILGGIVGAIILAMIFGSYQSLGANGFDTLSALPSITTMPVAILVEIILTFTFVLVVLAVSAKKDNHSNGLVIGLTLTLVHIMGLPFTGTSVNPARSIGPALFTGGEAFAQLWVFILAPVIGAIFAALFYRFVIKSYENETTKVKEIVVEEKVLEEPKKVVTKKSAPRKAPVQKRKPKKDN